MVRNFGQILSNGDAPNDNDYTNENSNIFDIFKEIVIDDMDEKKLRERILELEHEVLYLNNKLLKGGDRVKELQDNLKKSLDKCNELTVENSRLRNMALFKKYVV